MEEVEDKWDREKGKGGGGSSGGGGRWGREKESECGRGVSGGGGTIEEDFILKQYQ